MCITSRKAKLANTKIAVIASYKTDLHHMIYQNNPQNLSSGGNAMILPIPGKVVHIHDTTLYNNFLDEVAQACAPQMRGGSRSMVAKGIQIIEVGAYTVLHAKGIRQQAIIDALTKIPASKNPGLSAKLMQWYEDFYGPDAELLICCFNSEEMVKAQPIWVTYKPNNFARCFYPGADSHDGAPPKIGEMVDRDHAFFFGTISNMKRANATKVKFSQPVPDILQDVDWNQLHNVVEDEGKNGDWILHISPKSPGWSTMETVTEARNESFVPAFA